MQCGFMPSKGTTDAIFVVCKVQEKHLAKKDLYFTFRDLAFDRAPREVVRWTMQESLVWMKGWLAQSWPCLWKQTQ